MLVEGSLWSDRTTASYYEGCHSQRRAGRFALRRPRFLFLANEGPKFVTFDIAHLDVAYDAFAFLADKYEQFQDGRVMDFGSAFNARNAVAFEQKPEKHFGLLNGQVHAIERVITGAREDATALVALAPLTIAALPRLPNLRHSERQL